MNLAGPDVATLTVLAVLGVIAWLALAPLVAVLIGQVVRLRDRQHPPDSEPDVAARPGPAGGHP